MASFTTSNVSTNLVGRELSIASSFVKQYYTLLNKAPCYIHNFYSHDSTFIHGTISMANEHYTEPVVGREKIRRKMEDLKLNDCRAKIKQIDCLETLAGGLVIQVIGELSNNGKPMRRFLQTFVLAPSPDESSRQDGDSQHAGIGNAQDRRGVHLHENNSSSHNQKFFVLNSIFRYQDDGLENEFEDDVVNLQAEATVDSTNGGNELNKLDLASKQSHTNIQMGNSNGSVTDYSQNRRLRHSECVGKTVDDVERLAADIEDGVRLNKSVVLESDHKRHQDLGGSKTVSNGTGNLDKKNETSEKLTENGKMATDQSQQTISTGSSIINAANQPPPLTTTRPQPSNEPKTWANMVRNANPPPSVSQQITVNKPVGVEQQLHPNSTQTSSVQTHHQLQHQQQQNQQQQQNLNHNQPQQQQNLNQNQNQQQQQQPQQQQQQNPQNNNRRRHMMRKPSNKSTGRTIKNRPRPPVAAPTAAPSATSKPVA